MYRRLGDFLEVLQDSGQLVRIDVQVDPHLELAAITRRAAREGGPALLFTHVKDHELPVVTNLLGTSERVQRALEISADEEIIERLGDAADRAGGGLFSRLGGSAPQAWQRKYRPKLVKIGSCQQVVLLGRDVNLTDLPVPVCWPEEAGRCLTAGCVLTQSAETDERKIERLVLQILDQQRLAVAWPPYHPALKYLDQYSSRGENLPVMVALGGEGALTLTAAVPLPSEVDPWTFAGAMARRPLELVQCRSIAARAPADAELVIEGHVDPHEDPITMGPLGMPGGFYSVPCPARVIHVTALTHCSSPIFAAVVPGPAAAEDAALGRVVERLLLPSIRRAVPDLADYHLPLSGGHASVVFAAIRKKHPHHAQQAAAALWGCEPLKTAKLIVVVDQHVDVHAPNEVWRRVSANVHPQRDIQFHAGPGSPADHAAPSPLAGSAVVIDATSKLPEEHPRPWPAETSEPDEIRKLVDRRWREYSLGKVDDDNSK